MAGALSIKEAGSAETAHPETTQSFVTLRLGQQWFGIPVIAVRDVMRRQSITPVPLAPRGIAGLLNVRGRIATAIDLRLCLGLHPYPEPEKVIHILVEHQHRRYALLADGIGAMRALPRAQCGKVPANLDAAWRAVATGVFPLETTLLVVLDVAALIDPLHAEGAS